MNNNYDHLIGKEVRYEARGYDEGELTLVVAQIDPEVGITLTTKGDKSGNARMCLVHPVVHMSKHSLEFENDKQRRQRVAVYRKDVENWIGAIERGVFDEAWEERDDQFSQEYGFPLSANPGYSANEMCAFR